ncbi:hypothetical protein SynPROSU1_02332 [Synechococcus sp. PROS-U-1]|nr:hypothetical protein SynPROSU1_02332 [Synechococcus sp. PROS-U-1]
MIDRLQMVSGPPLGVDFFFRLKTKAEPNTETKQQVHVCCHFRA